MASKGKVAAADRSIENFRSFLKQKPKNARAMARLSCVLTERAKIACFGGIETCIGAGDGGKADATEAASWARKAMTAAPGKPFGFAALSVATGVPFDERMKALRRAVNLQEDAFGIGREEKEEIRPFAPVGGTGAAVALAIAMVRLLVEPREEDARKLRYAVGKAAVGRSSPRHPSRRDLSEAERDLYRQVRRALDLAASGGGEEKEDPESHAVHEIGASKETCFLAKSEYRLGFFFRKMMPKAEHRPSSRRHFDKAARMLPPGDPLGKSTRFWLATLNGDELISDGDEGITEEGAIINIDRCPEEYIVSLYSTFAAKFDDLLVNKLKYQTPTLLRKLLDSVIDVTKKKEVWANRGADLGCGTGLSGAAFRTCIRHLVGVDLSPEMIEKARDRRCYDSLVVGDVESILRVDYSTGEDPHSMAKPMDFLSFDIIFACDVFVYVGDLKSIFATVRDSLSPQRGIFAFSTECLEENAARGRPYVLHSCARFAHKRSYIEGLIREFGFKVRAMKTTPIRKNQGRDVMGNLFVLGC